MLPTGRVELILQRQLILDFLKNLLPLVLGGFLEATDSGFFEESVAFGFGRFFQRQLILDFLKNLLPLDLDEFFGGN